MISENNSSLPHRSKSTSIDEIASGDIVKASPAETRALHPRILALMEQGLGPDEPSRRQIALLGLEGQETLAILMEAEFRTNFALADDLTTYAERWRIHLVGLDSTENESRPLRGDPVALSRENLAAGPTGTSISRIGAPSPADHLRVSSFANVEPRSISWLWMGFIPLSAVTMLDGDPGLGKSTLTLDLAARVSQGMEMPGETKSSEAAGVLLLSAEDDPHSVIRPRLDAAGADLERVLTNPEILGGGPPRELLIRRDDLQLLESVLQERGVKLVVIDPLVAFFPGEINANRDQDVRRAMAGLRGLAERSGAAVVVVRHLRKAWSENALYRGGGSIGLIGAARAGLLVAQDPTDTAGERRILAVTKMNLAPIAKSRAFRLVAEEGASHPRVIWEGESELTARTLLVTPQSDEERSARREAEEFLEGMLSEGPCPATEVEAEAKQAGIAVSTLRRAKRAIGVKAQKVGKPGEEGQHWVWTLPSKVINEG